MSADFDSDLLQEMAENAPTAGFGPNINFGKLTVVANVVSWKDTGEKDANGKPVREAVTRPMKKGAGADKDKGEYVQLTFIVDIQEFNPALEWQYERTVDMKVTGPRTKTNWSEIVLPSLIATFGDDWTKKISKPVYVSVEDVSDVNGKVSKKGNLLTAPKFTQAFKNKAECQKAHAARFHKNGGVDSDGEIPAEVIGQVKGLVQAMGSVEQAAAMLVGKPFGDYEPNELLKAAGFEVTE